MPDTVSPSLWRQARLCAKDGLYEVVPGIYQVRGYDLSNVSVIEGDTGVIVIDPLTCSENAKAALALYGSCGASGPSWPRSTPTRTSTTSVAARGS